MTRTTRIYGWIACLCFGALGQLPAQDEPRPQFVRGDCNGDGSNGLVADALAMLRRNFVGGVDVPCVAACDANGDGETMGVDDAVTALTENFVSQGVIPPPFPFCGEGTPTDYNVLGCQERRIGCPD